MSPLSNTLTLPAVALSKTKRIVSDLSPVAPTNSANLFALLILNRPRSTTSCSCDCARRCSRVPTLRPWPTSTTADISGASNLMLAMQDVACSSKANSRAR